MNLQRKPQSLHSTDFIYQSCIYEPLDSQLIILGSCTLLYYTIDKLFILFGKLGRDREPATATWYSRAFSQKYFNEASPRCNSCIPPKKKELCHKLQSPTTELLCGANYSAAFPCAIHAIVKKRETAHTTIHYELRTMNNSTPSTIKNRVLVQYCPYNNRVLVQKVAGIFG